MPDSELLQILERRVRAVERLTADFILDCDVRRLERSVAHYRRTAKVPKDKSGRPRWPALSPRSTSLGWPTR